MTELWCIGKPLTREAPKPARGVWRFCETTFNGKTYCSIEYHAHGASKEATLGTTARRDLTPEQQEMSLDVLTTLFREQAVPPNTPSWDRDPVLRAKMVDRLAKIIAGSTQEGERNNARALYKRLTGKEFTP